ncbi:MAG: hypothetical protein JKY54_04450 [Flavobacteriales bacterium]|nr:hypothetical protein [Flavobacteriales bacterium]
MKNAISFILVSFVSISLTAQMKVERFHTIGVGISTGVPFKVLGHDTYEKYSIQYRKCVGFGIMKVNLNYVKNPHDDWNTNRMTYSLPVSDTSRHEFHYSESAYRTDVRVGLDKDVGQGNMRILAGVDLIIGQMVRNTKQNDTYYLLVRVPGSSEGIRTALSGASVDYASRFLKLGFDITVGFEFQLSDRINFTAQWAPEWNMYKKISDTREDEGLSSFYDATSYADILFAFDAFFSYKF